MKFELDERILCISIRMIISERFQCLPVSDNGNDERICSASQVKIQTCPFQQAIEDFRDRTKSRTLEARKESLDRQKEDAMTRSFEYGKSQTSPKTRWMDNVYVIGVTKDRSCEGIVHESASWPKSIVDGSYRSAMGAVIIIRKRT